MINAQPVQPTDTRPSDDLLRELASQPKMTFQEDNVTKLPAQAADKSAVDMPKVDTFEVVTPEKPEADTPIPSVEDLLQMILARQSWLTEYLVIIHERLRVIETGMSGLACPLPSIGDKEPSPAPDLYTMIMHIEAHILQILKQIESLYYEGFPR